MIYIIYSLLFIYLLINGFLYFFQGSLIFKPDSHMLLPHNYGLELEEIKLKTKDNIEIKIWQKISNNKDILVYFHGNTGNLSDRLEKIKALNNLESDFVALSYRGYGGSEGNPSEEGLYLDSEAVLEYVRGLGYTDKNIIIYGESLGTGVGINLSQGKGFKALILEAPYTSIVNRAKELYPYIAVNFLVNHRFESINKIGNVKFPVLIFHGYLDNVMPISHAKIILERANEPKKAIFYEHVGHTDFNYDNIIKEVSNFLRVK